jgi:multidrug efflux system outer membrane protein
VATVNLIRALGGGWSGDGAADTAVGAVAPASASVAAAAPVAASVQQVAKR